MVKKFMSILMSFVMLATITTGIDMSACASGKTPNILGITISDSFDPLSDEYFIGEQASQFDFFENYTSVENLKKWADKNTYYQFTPDGNKNIYDAYANKLGITGNNLNEYQKVAKIYCYLAKNFKGHGEATTGSQSAFIFRRAHCETFANTFMELCKRANIECWAISTTGHEWNIVKVDGKYYECDAMNNLTFMGNMQNVINTYTSSWMEIMNYDGSESYSGNGAINQWAKKHTSISTSDYAVPEESVGLTAPKTTTIATDEGVVVKWDPITNADWYEVYYANIDGITNDITISGLDLTTKKRYTKTINDGDYAYFEYGSGCSNTNSRRDIFFKTAGDMTKSNGNVVHSIDKNEKGQYQFFIENDKLTGYGTAIVVVAKNIDGKTSLSTKDAEAMAKSIGDNYTTNATTLKDKNNGKTVTNATILKINEDSYVINKTYNSKSHNINVKVATPIQTTKTAQGAEVYECPNCLQRKMVYTKALPCTHKYITTTTKATTSKNGSIVTECYVCGAKKSGTTIYYPKSISLSTTSYTYTGKSLKPDVVVKDSNGTMLKHKRDYLVTYPTNPTAPGTYTVKIELMGNYSGTKYLTYSIKPRTTAMNVSSTVNGFKVSWSKVAETTGYQIEYSTRSDFKGSALVYGGATNTLSKTITGRAAGTKYYVRVRTYKTLADGSRVWGDWSQAKAVTTNVAQATVKSVSGVTKGFKTTWNTIGGVTGYQIQYSTRKDFQGAATVYAGDKNAVEKTITGRAKNTTYYVRVRGYKNNGNGNYVWGVWSSAKTVRTK